MVNSDSYSVSVTFGKAVYEAHQRTCTHTFETLEQLKTSQASTDTINFYKNMVRQAHRCVNRIDFLISQAKHWFENIQRTCLNMFETL